MVYNEFLETMKKQMELADDAEELYPANERGSNAARRAFDGSVKDW